MKRIKRDSKDKVNAGIDGWDNRTGVIKRIDKYLYDNPEAIPPKGYIQPGSRAYDDAVSRYGDYVTTPFGNISTDDLMQYARDNKLLIEASYGGAFDIEDDQYSDWRELASKSVEDSDGFNTDYTLYTNGETYICMFGDKDLYEPDEAYADYETENEQDAWEWFNSYTGFADDDDFDDILESTEVVNSRYSPDLLNDLVNYYRSFDTMSSEEIWDEIVAKYNNEDLANDVLESLDSYEEDFDFADEEDEYDIYGSEDLESDFNEYEDDIITM